MNTISSDFKFFIDNDINPFLLFDSDLHVKYINKSAEYILGYEDINHLRTLVMPHAPKNYGAKKSILNLTVGTYTFYAINILYENDEEIALHLYLKPEDNTKQYVTFEGFTDTDINVILQANIELFKLDATTEIMLMSDFDIPSFKLHQNRFSILLKKIFARFKASERLKITLKYKIGEKVVVDGNRYNIITLHFTGTDISDQFDPKEILTLAKQNYINTFFEEKSVMLEIPMIIEEKEVL